MKPVDIIFILLILAFLLVLVALKKRRIKKNQTVSKCKSCPYAGLCSKRKNRK